MTAVAEHASDTPVTKADERRAAGVACGAHTLHDGYTDLIYIMLPIWQAEFGLSYAALGLLRSCFSGTMAGLQIPSGLLSEKWGVPLVLAGGTALSGIGYLIAGASVGFPMLVMALLIILATPFVLRKMAMDIFPEIDIPVISIIWNYNGLSAQEMGQRIAGQTERGLTTTVSDIEQIGRAHV